MYQGGIYLWRTRKPHAILGLPIIGRHNGYVGMTSCYSARGGQHLNGSVTYGSVPASWSDLAPKCYKILPLPAFLTHGTWRRALVMKRLETLVIGLLLPVYNDRQQAPWNLRKVSRASAKRARANRDDYGMTYRATAFAGRMAVNITLITLLAYGWTEGWFR